MAASQREALLTTLKARFTQNMQRHKNVEWAQVLTRLDVNTRALSALQAMEATGGEPDVTGHDTATGEYIFCDCSAETPTGRRSACYDREALDTRKENKPAHNAMDMAATMGIEMLTEAQYRALQTLGAFDTKTSSWVQTPPEIRARGGALFCDRRYGHVFTYHNGVQSYYAARGFRGSVRV